MSLIIDPDSPVLETSYIDSPNASNLGKFACKECKLRSSLCYTYCYTQQLDIIDDSVKFVSSNVLLKKYEKVIHPCLRAKKQSHGKSITKTKQFLRHNKRIYQKTLHISSVELKQNKECREAIRFISNYKNIYLKDKNFINKIKGDEPSHETEPKETLPKRYVQPGACKWSGKQKCHAVKKYGKFKTIEECLQKCKYFCGGQCKQITRTGFFGAWYSDSVLYFKGQVIKIENERYLFKRIYVSWDECLICREGREDHVWILKSAPLIKAGIKTGDCVSFYGEIKPYVRKNGTIDLEIANINNVEKIESYELPTDEDMKKQFFNQLGCEICIYHEHCNGLFCLRDP